MTSFVTYGYESIAGYVYDLTFDTEAAAADRVAWLNAGDRGAARHPAYYHAVESGNVPDHRFRGVDGFLRQMQGSGEGAVQ